jgi:hypothetical protein
MAVLYHSLQEAGWKLGGLLGNGACKHYIARTGPNEILASQKLIHGTRVMMYDVWWRSRHHAGN